MHRLMGFNPQSFWFSKSGWAPQFVFQQSSQTTLVLLVRDYPLRTTDLDVIAIPAMWLTCWPAPSFCLCRSATSNPYVQILFVFHCTKLYLFSLLLRESFKIEHISLNLFFFFKRTEYSMWAVEWLFLVDTGCQRVKICQKKGIWEWNLNVNRDHLRNIHSVRKSGYKIRTHISSLKKIL